MPLPFTVSFNPTNNGRRDDTITRSLTVVDADMIELTKDGYDFVFLLLTDGGDLWRGRVSVFSEVLCQLEDPSGQAFWAVQPYPRWDALTDAAR